jgi:hypothetical protein
MQALVFLTFLALSFGQSVWTPVVMVDGTDSYALVDTINWYRTGFDFGTPLSSIAGLDATLYSDPLVCTTTYDLTVTAVPTTEYTTLQGLADFWFDPSELTCSLTDTNGVFCDSAWCTGNSVDTFWNFALDPATVGIACWETTEADCGAGNAWMTCVFIDSNDNSFTASGSPGIDSCRMF